ncbi:hypothetical protein AX805_15765 [Listeria monocytogenes]|nr:hypothetical protein [Listeria monocytogenes]EAF9012015.1 hypothetical protein [Listeria monocytogenes]EAF9053996.1 hypothetical protein [Listeria monocytogenes]EAF9078526.1 hypothetical protein [Listeria monocytogenes]
MLQGMLVSKLGLSQSVAFAVVAALTAGGAELVSVMWPFLAPFLMTLKGILIAGGSAAVVGY